MKKSLKLKEIDKEITKQQGLYNEAGEAMEKAKAEFRRIGKLIKELEEKEKDLKGEE